MSVYVTDTHPLVWYAGNVHSKLSRKVKRIFERAWEGEALIYIPAVVLWEVSFLIKDGEFRIKQEFGQWVTALAARPGFDVAALDAEIIRESFYFTFNDDPFDHAIVATAKIKDLSLITKDQAITGSRLVDVEW